MRRKYHKRKRVFVNCLSIFLVTLILLSSMAPIETVEAASYQLEQDKYNGKKLVFWDGCVGKNALRAKSKDRIKSVEFIVNGEKATVNWADSGLNVPLSIPEVWRTGTQISHYYKKATKSQDETIPIVITPQPGYYITSFVIACTAKPDANVGAVPASPYNCGTWEVENAFTKTFSFVGNDAVTADVPSYAFGHQSNDGPYTKDKETAYFILIEVAPLPSPLYVEYQYGDIVDKITNSDGKAKFTETAEWVTKAASNQYGNGEMQTANTQHKYSYQAGLSDEAAAAEAAKWKHTAGDITPEAESAALEAGYTFAGWKAEYYPECTESSGTGTNNRTYHFSGNLYAQTNYDAGNPVTLYTHVKLIAQWKKVEGGAVKVTKTVTGDEIDVNKEFTFTAKLKKDGVQIPFPTSVILSGAVTQEKIGEAWSFTLKHNGSATFSNLPLGSVLEVEERGDSDYKTTINGVEKRSDSATVVSETTPSINFQNELLNKTTNITIKKTVTGNMGDLLKPFKFKVSMDHNFKTPSGEAVNSYEFSLKNNESITLTDVIVGTKVTVSEETSGYNATATLNGNEQKIVDGKTDFDVNEKIEYVLVVNNHKEVLIDNGIWMDVLPYTIILISVFLGGIFLFLHRCKIED